MPGESPVKDLAEWAEFWNEHERLGIPPIAIARYLVACLSAVTDALRALPEKPAEQETRAVVEEHDADHDLRK